MSSEVEIVIQVSSKIRGKVVVAADASQDDMVAAALADAGVQKHIDGKQIRKTIVVSGKLVNFIVG